MQRLGVRTFALAAYAASQGASVYFAGFATGIGVPVTVDVGPSASPLAAIAIDVGLVLFFGVVHSVMARATFKRAWTRLVPVAAERSAYVLIASAQIALLCWQWRPILSPVLWQTTGAVAFVLRTIGLLGWGLAVASTFQIDHFELFGLRQGFAGPARSHASPTLRTPLLYRAVRHPLYLGMLLGIWIAPAMTAGHLLLAALLTTYILVGVRHEERDLVRVFGDDYRRYRTQVPMLLPFPR